MSAGTLTLTNNSAAVTGTGTPFNTELAAGDFIVFIVGGVPYTLPVKSVESATALTLVSAYTGPTQSGAAWYAVPRVALNMVTGDLVTKSAEALRGLNYDKQNWQQVFSGTGTVTVKLPDGSTYTGPAWNSITTALNGKAAKGANTDITSLGGLTTALSVTQGGTGGKTPADARAGIGAPAGVDKQMCTAWAMFAGTSSAAPRNGFNISSVTLLDTGVYQVNFATQMKDTNYCVTLSYDPDSDLVAYFNAEAAPRVVYVPNSQRTVSNFRIYSGANASPASVRLNMRFFSISVFGGN